MYERTNQNSASINGTVNTTCSEKVVIEDARSNGFLYKVYGYTAIMLLITFVVAYALGIPMMFGMRYAANTGDVELLEKVLYGYIALCAISGIGLFATSIIINIRAFTRKHSVKVPGVFYSIFMGITLASIVGIVNEEGTWIIPAVFAIVAMMFGIMFFVSKLVKNIHWFGTIAIAIGIGVLLLSGVSVLLYFIVAPEFFAIFLLTEILIFVFFIFVTIYDIATIQRIANSGCADQNVAMFCALNLYSDFIEIFLKVLWFVLKIVAASKKS